METACSWEQIIDLAEQWENDEPQKTFSNGKEIITTKSTLICRKGGMEISAKVLDLTDPKIASEWGFLKGESSLLECQNIAEIALNEGYNVIKVHSYRDAGINYVIYDNFDEILQPQMVTLIGD